MYKKIDIYYSGRYVCSTNQASSLSDAKQRFIKNHSWAGLGANGVELKTISSDDPIDFAIFKVHCKYSE